MTSVEATLAVKRFNEWLRISQAKRQRYERRLMARSHSALYRSEVQMPEEAS